MHVPTIDESSAENINKAFADLHSHQRSSYVKENNHKPSFGGLEKLKPQVTNDRKILILEKHLKDIRAENEKVKVKLRGAVKKKTQYI